MPTGNKDRTGVLKMKKYLQGLCFELTRRCNMNCEFCSKGAAQNTDITTEIIDKALDEFEQFDIYHIRVNGGESLLNKQGLLYLIDEIIRRDFKICQFLVFTNGTVQDQDIKAALVRVGEHCKKCAESNWGKNMTAWEHRHYKRTYNVESYTSIIVSTNFHDNDNIINDTIAFYNESVDPEIMCTVNQTDSYIFDNPNDKTPTIAIEGNAEKNIKSLYEQGYRKMRLYSNRYSLIDEYNDISISIQKTITVSANGNVVSGCTQSYESADYKNICNIFDCNGNLYDYINNYSWEYPLSRQQAGYLMNIITYNWLYDRGMQTSIIDVPKQEQQQMYETFDRFIKQVTVYSEMIKRIHQEYSTLSQPEARELAGLLLAHEQTEDTRRFVIEWYCGYDNDCNFSLEQIETMIQLLVLEHQNRVLERVDKALQNINFNKLFSKLFWNKNQTVGNFIKQYSSTPVEQTGAGGKNIITTQYY